MLFRNPALKVPGINYSDLDVLSDSGINWLDLDMLSDSGQLALFSRADWYGYCAGVGLAVVVG